MNSPEQARERGLRYLKMLEEGLSFEEIERKLMPAERSESLRRVALLRNFDTEDLARVLMGVEIDQSSFLDWLRESRNAVEVGFRSGLYRLDEELRKQHLERWEVRIDSAGTKFVGEPEEVRLFEELHRELATGLAEIPERRLDFLHHQLVAEPADGIARMETLLDERLPHCPANGENTKSGKVDVIDASHADAFEGIALGRAFDVLSVVKGQIKFLTADHEERYETARRLADTWAHWSQTWHRARRYVKRAPIEGWYHDLLAQAEDEHPQRILEIVAPGGSGKTMTLRWLLTHYCIPRRIPVAHLDFDHFLGTGVQEPWQLLLRCAEQLNLQIPFDNVIKSGRKLDSLLQGSEGSTPMNTQHANLSESRFAEAASEFESRFERVFNSDPAEQVLIVVDTLEEALNRGLTDVGPFIALFVRLVEKISKLRLIVCGRYGVEHSALGPALRADHPEIHDIYTDPDKVRREVFPLFGEDEARKFLADRGVPELTPELFGRLYENSGGSPFHLSLVADLIDAKEEAEAVIEDCEQVEFIYLVERVIKRIEKPAVHWVVRYGVVPNSLSRDFLREVIFPRLQGVRDGRAEDDNPGEDKLPGGRSKEQWFSSTGVLLENESADELWSDLLRFASCSSWVEPDPHHPDRVIFHPCVREPMLAILKERAVLKSIHEEAAGYFSRKAAEAQNESERADCNRELRFHQREAGASQSLYDGALERAFAEERFEEAYKLAVEIEEVREDEKENALTAQILASLDLYDTGSGFKQTREFLTKAHGALGKLRALADQRDAANLDRWLGLLGAMVVVRRESEGSEFDEAFEVLRGHADGPEELPPEVQVRVKRTLALGLAIREDAEVVEVLADLVAERLSVEEPGRLAPLTQRLFDQLAWVIPLYGGSPDAYRAFERAMAHVLTISDEHHRLHVALVGADVWSQIGRGEGAYSLVEGFEVLEDTGPHVEYFRAYANLRRGELSAALEQLNGILLGQFGKPSGQRRGHCLETRGIAYALLCDPHLTKSNLADAEGTFESEGRQSDQSRCLLLRGEYSLHEFGNLNWATHAVEQRDTSVFTDEGGDAIRFDVLKLELERKRGNLLKDRLGGLLDDAEKSARLDDKCRAALFILTVELDPKDGDLATRAMNLLLSYLEKLPDGLAFSEFPPRFRQVTHLLQVEEKQAKRLTQLLAREPSSTLSGLGAGEADQSWAELEHAHLLRCLGRYDEARSLASRVAKSNRPAVFLRELWHLDAKLRASDGVGVDNCDPGFGHELNAEGGERFLREVIEIEQAEHCLRAGKIKDAANWLTVFPQGIGLAKVPTHWTPRGLLVMAQLDEHGVAIDSEERTAEGLRLVAAGHYEKLGDLREAEAIRKQIETGVNSGNEASRRPTGEPWPLRPHWRMTCDGERGPELLRINAGGLPEPSVRFELPPDVSFFEKSSQREAAPMNVVESVFSDPQGVASRFHGHLSKVFETVPGREGTRYDLGIVAKNPPACRAFPWELLQFNSLSEENKLGLIYRLAEKGHHRITWLQVMLQRVVDPKLVVDGVWGPYCRRVLQEFSEKVGSEDPEEIAAALRINHANGMAGRNRVLILLPGPEKYEQYYRGMEFAERSLPKLYEEFGFKAEVMTGKDFLTAFRIFMEVPAIVHVYAPYFENQSRGTVEPELRDGNHLEEKGGSESKENLVSHTPLVILDGPAEESPLEHVRQLFLRNAAATNMARHFDLPNILGIGLDRHPDYESYQRLLGGIRKAVSMRELYAGLTSEAPPALTEEALMENIGRVAPALWTADPDLSVLLPWRGF